jgi:hypothetical protein
LRNGPQNCAARNIPSVFHFLNSSSAFILHHSTPFTMSRYLLLHLLFTATRHFAHAEALSGCFLPNGTALPFSRAYEPCIATQNIVSMCCVLNATALEALGESAADVDICLENGMCQPPAGSPGQFARNLCTDHTWKSPNCLNVCTDPSVSLLPLTLLFPRREANKESNRMAERTQTQVS